ncbi:hypothetical protein C6P40_000386 [Pichia californica]|uniref:Mitochondrial 15S rRNA processing factor CCM1 n=1 Tax=Pichia californica TaxID=460514 RepID=A0A9P6WKV8_9ASCO|nr:hypothetical protein C6P42_001193 [[Candida] californica]KAG0688887.1 hypothetical protein C6P40_000386 [[Candida] californica]
MSLNNRILQIRQFSNTRFLLGQKTKAKINIALTKQSIPLDKKHYEAVQIKKRKDFNNTPVKNDSAQKLLTNLLGREFKDDEIIGPNTPLTTKELDIIFKQSNIRLTYKVLGTSGRQIQDSLTVDEDVKKLLSRNDLFRAKELARLARYQGLFAYGTILQYLLNRGQINDAFEIFMNLKRRGYSLKGRLYNILISGYADSISKRNNHGNIADISHNKIEQLYRAFQKDHKEYNSELSIIHVNSLLKVFRKSKRLDLALHLYDSLKEVRTGKLRIKPDIRTYTEILRILSNAKPNELEFEDIVNRAETIFFNAQHNIHIKIDPFLVRAYVSLYAYCDDLKLRARAIIILREWFRISSIEEIKQEINIETFDKRWWDNVLNKNGTKVINNTNKLRLLSNSEINQDKRKRFDPDDAVVRMYKELCGLFKIQCTYKEKGEDVS